MKQFEDNYKVKVKSLVNATIGIKFPQSNLRRDWIKRGQILPIPFGQLQEAIFDPGIEYMFREGMLGIDDLEVKQALGLEPEDVEEPVNIIILDDAQKERYLRNLPFKEFKEKIGELPKEQIKQLCDYAIEHEIADIAKADYLKKLGYVDIVRAIQLNREDKEEVNEKE